MRTESDILIQGYPELTSTATRAAAGGLIKRGAIALLHDSGQEEIRLTVGTRGALRTPVAEGTRKVERRRVDHHEEDLETRIARFRPRAPLSTYDQLVLPEEARDQLDLCLRLFEIAPIVYDEWGMRAIERNARRALSFSGKPGTGKTLAAEGIAHDLGRPILAASYADIESKFHGDGPKNVQAVFRAAERAGAVLFIDEAESLLSKRLTNVNQGSEQAINSMRSQLLIGLEQYSGIVIFATNLVENYDPAFDSRVRHVHFPMPDEICRRVIWQKMLPPLLPLAPDVDVNALAERQDDVSGRDIRNATLEAAQRAATRLLDLRQHALAEASSDGVRTRETQFDVCVTQCDLEQSIDRIVASRPVRPRPLTDDEKTRIGQKISQRLRHGAKNETSDVEAASESGVHRRVS